MKVTDKDVAYVAELANLELTEQERQRMLKDLNSILDYIDRLNQLDTANVPPMAQIATQSGQKESARADELIAARDDIPVPSLPHAAAMQNAPETDGEFFKVPKVIEK
jgi:aspartyl-tRNA(Asn)/glutamyl-tRNA(Gln) amidotransferase subunit C